MGDYIKELSRIERKLPYVITAVELEAVKGEPKVLVMGKRSGYSCVPSAAKAGDPFAAGILWENDREYPVAEALASVAIRRKPLNRFPILAFEAAVRVPKTAKSDPLPGKFRNVPGILQTVMENSGKS